MLLILLDIETMLCSTGFFAHLCRNFYEKMSHFYYARGALIIIGDIIRVIACDYLSRNSTGTAPTYVHTKQ